MRYYKITGVLITLILLATTITAGEIVQRYDFSEPDIERVGEYDRIVIDGTRTMGSPGEPMLPIKDAKILLPAGEVVREIEVITGDKIVLLGSYRIEPGQRPCPLSYRGPREETPPDERIYGSDDPYPGEIYKRISVQRKYGYNILVLNIFPVEYIPKSGLVSYYRNITVRVYTMPAVRVLNETQKMLRKDEASKDGVIGLIDNPQDIISYTSLNKVHKRGENLILDPSDSCDYVIVTNESLSPSFDTLVAFKTRRGIRTRIKTVDEIYTEYTGDDNQEKIRNFIIDAYLNWGIDYVLLGGDEEIIPHRGLYGAVNTNPPTVDYDIPADIYYAGLDGNWNTDGDNAWGESGEDDLLMEVSIGRVAVATSAEASNFISKMILYQDSPVSGDCTEALMVGEDLYWNWGKFYKEEIRLGSSNYGYTTVGFPSQFNVGTLYDNDGYWSVSTLISLLNGGMHLVNHLGHADVTRVMKLYNSDVLTSFTNDGVNTSYFIIYSQGCYCNSFDNRTTSGSYTSDAISEHFTCKIDNGAVAFLGNTRYGWGTAPGTDGGSQHFDREFFDAVFGEEIYKIGNAQQDSKEDNIGFIYRCDIRWCYYAHNLLGDPEMDIWTNIPESLYVNHPSVIPFGTSGFIVTVTDAAGLPVEGARVCVMGTEDTLLYVVGETDASGSVTLVTTAVIPGDSATITVTGHNYIPYEGGAITIVPGSIIIDPDEIQCGVSTDVSVFIYDPFNEPMEDIVLTIDGIGVGQVDTTDENGSCIVSVYPPYGEILKVRARPIGEEWYIGRDSITVVGGEELTNPDILAEVPVLSISDTLVSDIEGVITASTDESGFTVCIIGCGVDTSSFIPSNSAVLGVTPSSTGNIVTVIGKEGYDLYNEEFPVINLFGTISGIVRDEISSNLIGGATVQIYRDESTEPVFEVFTNTDGIFAISDSLKVGPFILMVMGLGYEDYTDTLFLLRGPNTYEIELVPGEMMALSGVVNLRDTGDNSGVTIEACYEDYTFSTTDDDRGNYILNLPPGALYTLRAYKEGYIEDRKDGVSVPQSDVNFTLYPVTTLYFTDFEEDGGEMTSTLDWQWGAPISGPSGAYSGEKLWATKLGGNYSNCSDSKLTMPEVLLPDALYIALSFYHWYSTESNYDGGNVKLSTGGDFTVIEPYGGYPEDAIASGNQGITGEPAYSGTSGGWEKAVFDITSYAGDSVRIRLHFGSDSWVVESGWYVDDVWIGYVDSTDIHDVGVLSLSLPDSVYQDSAYIPVASVYNYGVTESPFSVVCSIGNYIDSVLVDVPPMTRVDVEFVEWTPDIGDTTLTARVETRLIRDGAPENDVMEKEIYVISSIGVDEDIPKVFALYQNSPNPFGDVTRIRYALPKKGKVCLEVYNLLGQRVSVLDSGVKAAGFYDVKWDGRDSRGVCVSCGIYFVRFSSGDFHSIKKIVKIR